jgi:hypothetical protein
VLAWRTPAKKQDVNLAVVMADEIKKFFAGDPDGVALPEHELSLLSGLEGVMD